MVMCNDIIIIEYNRRRLGLSSAPVIIEHDNNRDHRDMAIALNINLNISKHTFRVDYMDPPSHPPIILYFYS